MRLTIMFLSFLALATLAAGVTYQNAAAMLDGYGSVWNGVLFALSAPLLVLATLVLWRIIDLTAPKQARKEFQS